MVAVKRVSVCIFIVCMVIFSFLLDAIAQNKVVVVPLMDDGITCKGTLVGTRWCDNGDATVTDMTTGLGVASIRRLGGQKPWRSDTSGDHDDADTQAAILQDGVFLHTGAYNVYLSDGSGDGSWRLPTWKELDHLAHGMEAVSSVNMRAFSGVQSTVSYWSSSTYKDPSDPGNLQEAWVVYMLNGFSNNLDKTYHNNMSGRFGAAIDAGVCIAFASKASFPDVLNLTTVISAQASYREKNTAGPF